MTNLLLGTAGFLMCLLSFIIGTRFRTMNVANLPRGAPENDRLQKEFEEACANLIGYSVEKAYERQTH